MYEQGREEPTAEVIVYPRGQLLSPPRQEPDTLNRTECTINCVQFRVGWSARQTPVTVNLSTGLVTYMRRYTVLIIFNPTGFSFIYV